MGLAMGRIKNAIGRLFTPIPFGSTRKAYVRGSIARRQVPFDNRILPGAGDIDSGSDVIAALVSAQVADLVGTGVRPTLDTGSDALNERLMLLFEAWGRDAEVSGLTWDDTIALACRLWLRDGEAFVVFTTSGRVQLLGAADLPATAGNEGVEVDAGGRPVAYHFQPGLEAFRVDAGSVLHLAHRTNPRQLRGISPLLPALAKIQDLAEYDQAEQAAAKAAAKVVYMIRSESGRPAMKRGVDGNIPDDTSSGIVFDRLRPGESVETIKAHRPNAELSNYRAAILRAIAATTGADYCAISRDSPGSFSAARHLTVLAERDADARHAQLRRQILEPLWRWLVMGWSQSGQIALTDATRERALSPKNFPRLGQASWIDPSKQASAAATLLDSGIYEDASELRRHFASFSQ